MAEQYEELQKIEAQAYEAASEIIQEAGMKPGQLFVVGCSTSEVGGSKIGTFSSPMLAQAVYDGIYRAIKEAGVYLAAQCCEHLKSNRSSQLFGCFID